MIQIVNLGLEHPSTYKLTLKNAIESRQLVAISTGGGMIDIVQIDDIRLSIAGDYFETLIFMESRSAQLAEALSKANPQDQVLAHRGRDYELIEYKGSEFLSREAIEELSRYPVRSIRCLSPVLPTLSRKGLEVPYLDCREMLEYNSGRDYQLWELGECYEAARGGISRSEVFDRMRSLVHVMRSSIDDGIQGTDYADRILGYQSGAYRERIQSGALLEAGVLDQMIFCVAAIMEVKSAMGVIVAAPTAGACGVLPGSCLGAAEVLGYSEDEIVKSMLAAGMIGIFIAANSTFAAEVCGCQAECGAGSGMAAAGLVTLAKGTIQQALAASSMALQNSLGWICDPVANRVEVPCLGKNVLGAANALACANMALAGFDPVIPLDEVIETMDRVGKSLPGSLRCTGLGGLSVTPASKALGKELARRKT
jgi:L-serine dehydratase